MCVTWRYLMILRDKVKYCSKHFASHLTRHNMEDAQTTVNFIRKPTLSYPTIKKKNEYGSTRYTLSTHRQNLRKTYLSAERLLLAIAFPCMSTCETAKTL